VKPRGYTIVELLMALSVLAIGVSGIIAMQKVTVASNRHAKNLAIATQIARGWQAQLAADAAQWNHPSPQSSASDLNTDTRWLRGVGNAGVWFGPDYDALLDFGPGFDALGNVVDTQNAASSIVFCTDLRLTWLYPDLSGNGLIRAEVRVYWPRDGMAAPQPFCEGPMDDALSDRYHVVYQTTAIKQNTAP
jgi:prepilin-type N-terminal cleavage/methylation domain-containing protein